MSKIGQVILAGSGLVLGSLLVLSGCGTGGSGSGSGSTQSYTGAGSRWDVTLASDNTFTITHRPSANGAVDMTVNGTYQELASGFLKLTVGSATGAGAPSPGEAGYALNVPGYVFILKPLDPHSDQIIPMIKSGSCPSGNMSANWVMVKGTSVNGEVYGTFAFDAATQTASLPTQYDLSHSSGASYTLGSGVCKDGILTVAGDDMFLTEGGGAIVHVNPGSNSDEIYFGLAPKSVGSVNALDGSYAGLLFDDSNGTGSKILPVAVSCSSGRCTGNMITDIDNNVLSPDSVTINLTTADNPSTGFVTGTIEYTQPNPSYGNLTCMVNLDAQGSGRNIMSCVGQSPGNNSQMFNVLLVSK